MTEAAPEFPPGPLPAKDDLLQNVRKIFLEVGPNALTMRILRLRLAGIYKMDFKEHTGALANIIQDVIKEPSIASLFTTTAASDIADTTSPEKLRNEQHSSSLMTDESLLTTTVEDSFCGPLTCPDFDNCTDYYCSLEHSDARRLPCLFGQNAIHCENPDCPLLHPQVYVIPRRSSSDGGGDKNDNDDNNDDDNNANEYKVFPSNVLRLTEGKRRAVFKDAIVEECPSCPSAFEAKCSFIHLIKVVPRSERTALRWDTPFEDDDDDILSSLFPGVKPPRASDIKAVIQRVVVASGPADHVAGPQHLLNPTRVALNNRFQPLDFSVPTCTSTLGLWINQAYAKWESASSSSSSSTAAAAAAQADEKQSSNPSEPPKQERSSSPEQAKASEAQAASFSSSTSAASSPASINNNNSNAKNNTASSSPTSSLSQPQKQQQQQAQRQTFPLSTSFTCVVCDDEAHRLVKMAPPTTATTTSVAVSRTGGDDDDADGDDVRNSSNQNQNRSSSSASSSRETLLCGVVCSSGTHFTCEECLSHWITKSWADIAHTPGIIPTLPCPGEDCKSEDFQDSHVVRHITEEALEVYLDVRQRARDALAYTQASETLKEALASAEKSKAAIAEKRLLEQQMRRQFTKAIMCPKCKLMADHADCADFAAHHGQRGYGQENASKSSGVIDNSCKWCGFFSRSRNGWLKWDGVLRDEDELEAKKDEFRPKPKFAAAAASASSNSHQGGGGGGTASDGVIAWGNASEDSEDRAKFGDPSDTEWTVMEVVGCRLRDAVRTLEARGDVARAIEMMLDNPSSWARRTNYPWTGGAAAAAAAAQSSSSSSTTPTAAPAAASAVAADASPSQPAGRFAWGGGGSAAGGVGWSSGGWGLPVPTSVASFAGLSKGLAARAEKGVQNKFEYPALPSPAPPGFAPAPAAAAASAAPSSSLFSSIFPAAGAGVPWGGSLPAASSATTTASWMHTPAAKSSASPAKSSASPANPPASADGSSKSDSTSFECWPSYTPPSPAPTTWNPTEEHQKKSGGDDDDDAGAETNNNNDGSKQTKFNPFASSNFTFSFAPPPPAVAENKTEKDDGEKEHEAAPAAAAAAPATAAAEKQATVTTSEAAAILEAAVSATPKPTTCARDGGGAFRAPNSWMTKSPPNSWMSPAPKTTPADIAESQRRAEAMMAAAKADLEAHPHAEEEEEEEEEFYDDDDSDDDDDDEFWDDDDEDDYDSMDSDELDWDEEVYEDDDDDSDDDDGGDGKHVASD